MAAKLSLLLRLFLLTLITQDQPLTSASASPITVQTVPSAGQYGENQQNQSEIIWNGCESFAAVTKYDFPSVEKPTICLTGIPEYLENVKAQKGKPPFSVKIVEAGIGIGGRKSLFITVAAKHNKDDGKVKSHSMGKQNTFKSLYISAKSLDGDPVGHFSIDDQGTREEYSIGYCCGESRNSPNMYELNVEGGEWTTDVLWDPSTFSGFVNFIITVVQDKKVYWILPPSIMYL